MKNQSSDITLTGFAALIGLDWGHGSHAIALQISGATTETSTLEHSAENLHQWLDQLEKRCSGRPVAVAIEASKGAAVYALLERPWITVYPIHPATSTRHQRRLPALRRQGRHARRAGAPEPPATSSRPPAPAATGR